MIQTTSEEPSTRLYIAPFDADLLKLVIPASILPHARNFSYHTVETAPEARYGFVELPTPDADRIKKKLNGAVLRGLKLRVDKARPDSMPEPAGKAAVEPEKKTKKSKSSKDDKGSRKKRKRDIQEIQGVQLEEGRKVKRGWTEPEDKSSKSRMRSSDKNHDRSDKVDKETKNKGKKDKKDRKSRKIKSRYIDGPECLVKTVLPPGKGSPVEKSGDDAGGKKKRRKGTEREVVVHEFEKTTMFPSFLQSSASSGQAGSSAEFVEGVGWVGQDGKVVEKKRTSRTVEPSKLEASRKKVAAAIPSEQDDDTTSSESSSDDDAEESETSDEESTSAERAEEATGEIPDPQQTAVTETHRPKSSSSNRNLHIEIPPPITPSGNKIHPLEALYKRAKVTGTPGDQDNKPQDQLFSFFDNDVDMQDDEGGAGEVAGSQPPMTPFTQQEFEWRNVRSAAPTPDTAHPNKAFRLFPQDDIAEENEEEDHGDEDMAEAASIPETSSAATATGDFQKWFWEHRGDLNRSWKKRRKTAAKEKRYRENRARAERAV